MKDLKERTKDKPAIVINRMYAGDYLSRNLGHEIINLIQMDNGYYYLYLNPYGNFSNVHSDKIGFMLMVKYFSKNTFEVIGMAKNLLQLKEVDKPYKKYQDNKYNSIFESQLKFIKEDEGGIKYNNIPLNEIFNNAEQQTIFITFKVKEQNIFIPKNDIRIFIKYSSKENESNDLNSDHKVIVLKGYKFPKQSLKSYLYPEGKYNGETNVENLRERQEDYQNVLNNIINNKELWTNPTNINNEFTPTTDEEEVSIFDICRIQNDENSISNALSFFLMDSKYRDFWIDFFADCDIFLERDFTVEREVAFRLNKKEKSSNPTEGRIDLLIRDSKNIVVIENKIKSTLNRVISDPKNWNQLHRYLDYIMESVENEFDGNQNYGLKPYFRLLTPNYNIPDLLDLKDKYKIITYGKLYEFLKKHEYKDLLDNDPNFKSFRDVIFRHTLPNPNDFLRYEMKRKFNNRIKEFNK